MLDQINEWIDQTIKNHSNQKISCEHFSSQFNGFYPKEFLSETCYVVVNSLPRPDFPELRQAGFGSFIDMELEGITYKNTYFIKKGYEGNAALHFHELVHVIQWQNLGALPFIQRYMEEIRHFGYLNAPLEKMAYDLQNRFVMGKGLLSVPDYVQGKI